MNFISRKTYKIKMYSARKKANANFKLKMQNEERIRKESQIKSSGWFGFHVGSERPRRIRIDNLEMGWTAWKFQNNNEIFWYNVLNDVFQDERPERSEYIRRCPGCKDKMDLTYPSQFCSRSCMYENV